MLTNEGNSYVFKEYFNMKDFYIRISLQENQDIHLVCYNSSLLNGIKYETLIKSEEISQKTNNFSAQQLYEITIKKLDENKCTIQSDENAINLVLLETSNIFPQNKDILLSIPKNKSHVSTDYEKVLSNEINLLRQENKSIKSELTELKNMIKLLNCAKNNNNINSINNPNPYANLRNRNPNQLNNSINSSKKSSSSLISNLELKNSKNNSNNNSKNKNKNSQKNNNLKNTLKNSSIPQPKGDISNNINNLSNKNIINNDENNNSSNNNTNNVNNLSISKISKLSYLNYPQVELSPNSFSKIIGYGANSYNGTVRDHNEDKLKIILEYKLDKIVTNSNGGIINPHISYFAIYDGHAGNTCSNFLQENLHSYLFSSDYFPLLPLHAIYQAYEKAELNFELIALDQEKKILLDKSGSCSLSALMIDEWCYVTYLGDSRGIYSFDSGKQFFQVTRDHKPNDLIEKTRIEKSGGKIYKDTRLKVDGVKIRVNEKDAPGIKFPYRVSPGNLAVSLLSF